MKIELEVTDGKNVFDSDVYIEMRGEPKLLERILVNLKIFIAESGDLTIK